MRVRHLAAILLLLLVACEETQLEPTPDAITPTAETCPQDEGWTKVDDPEEGASGDWGTATPFAQSIDVHVNDGYVVEFCVKGGQGYATYTVVGEADRTLFTPVNENNDDYFGLSHYAYRPSGGATSTTGDPTTTTAVDESTTTEGGATSTSEGGESTTTTEVIAEITTTTGGDTPTTGDEGGGLEGTTTTVDPDGTTTVDPDGTTTVDPDETTTTIAGSGQEGTGGTGSSGSGQDVGGSDQEAGEDTLAYTGAGDISLATLALSLVAAGVLLLLSLRRHPEGD